LARGDAERDVDDVPFVKADWPVGTQSSFVALYSQALMVVPRTEPTIAFVGVTRYCPVESSRDSQ
jgi:hypothetical protein